MNSDLSVERLPLLRVRDLRTSFNTPDGKVTAVNGISFDVNHGETLGLVGESGCGKSVSALSIMRLVPNPPGMIERGEVLFEGTDLLKISEREMQLVRGVGIGMIFQEPMSSLNPVLTIGRQITEPLEVHLGLTGAAAQDRASELLEMVGIADSRRRLADYPHQLSGGQRQRVMIAIALSCEPKLLIADEATTALDVTIQAQVINLLMDLQAEQKISFLFISHDMAVVERIAHRVAVMYAGEIVEIGGRRDVFNNPQHSYTKKLLGSVPVADPRQRKGSRAISIDEIPSVIHPVGYEPVHLPFRHVSDNQYVREEV